MKKIIDGKKYDTETAQHIGTRSNNRGYGDFSWFEEELYRKRTGEFFLYGKGGAWTGYAELIGSNTWTSGSSIIPLEDQEAKEWVEKYLDCETYERLWGPVEE